MGNLQHQQTLRPLIEQQIYNAQVGQKAVLLLKDLVIGFGENSWVNLVESLSSDGCVKRTANSGNSVHSVVPLPYRVNTYQRTDKMAKFSR